MGYLAFGESDDWLYDQGIISMSPEVGPESGGFWPANGHILPICRRNWRRMRYLALKAGCELVVDASGGIRNEGLADCAGVSVIARDLGGQILLVRHSYGPPGWFLPGGGIGRRETPEQAAHREIREEISCTIEGLKPLGVIEEELSGAPHSAHIFAGVVDAMPRVDGREVVEARFFPIHSLPEPLSARTAARLALWQNRKN